MSSSFQSLLNFQALYLNQTIIAPAQQHKITSPAPTPINIHSHVSSPKKVSSVAVLFVGDAETVDDSDGDGDAVKVELLPCCAKQMPSSHTDKIAKRTAKRSISTQDKKELGKENLEKGFSFLCQILH